MMGAPLTLKHPDLANIRKWQVKDFDTHLGWSQWVFCRQAIAWSSSGNKMLVIDASGWKFSTS